MLESMSEIQRLAAVIAVEIHTDPIDVRAIETALDEIRQIARDAEAVEDDQDEIRERVEHVARALGELAESVEADVEVHTSLEEDEEDEEDEDVDEDLEDFDDVADGAAITLDDGRRYALVEIEDRDDELDED